MKRIHNKNNHDYDIIMQSRPEFLDVGDEILSNVPIEPKQYPYLLCTKLKETLTTHNNNKPISAVTLKISVGRFQSTRN